MAIRHPAKFSREVLDLIEREQLLPEIGVVLDPMAGVGGIHRLATVTRKTVGIEIEPEWAAAAHPDTMVGNALQLPFGSGAFDAVCTSPCYGNRLADHHKARDGSERRSYTHDLQWTADDPERQLHPENSGTLRATSKKYWDFHERAWSEVRRILKPDGVFVLNVSDHISKGAVVNVVGGHTDLALGLGFELTGKHAVATRRLKFGANASARVPEEIVLVFRRS